MNLTFNLPAYPAVFLGDERDAQKLSGGDKIILPSTVLERLMTRFGIRPMPHPLTFQLTNVATKKQSHCGVLEFSAPEERVYMADWMMDSMHLEDGSQVRIELVELPKLTSVTVRPMSREFGRLQHPQRALEYALENHFTCLTEGDVIRIHQGNNEYSLVIEEVAPASPFKGGCIVDTTLTMQFSEVQGDEEEDVVQDLVLDEPVDMDAGADSFSYFRFKVADPQQVLQITVHANQGDPDLYASSKDMKPNLDNHEWRQVSSKGESLVLSPEDLEEHGVSWLYLGVHAYATDASFQIVVTETDPEPMGPPQGGKLLRLYTEERADASLCPICEKHVPPSAMTMHSLRCAKVNWRCNDCNVVMSVSEKAEHGHCPECGIGMKTGDIPKHVDLDHRSSRCRCGAEVERGALRKHEETECPNRMVQCSLCDAPVMHVELGRHESYCKSKSVPCERCGVDVPRKSMVTHMAVEHDINPCLDEHGRYPSSLPQPEKEHPGFGRLESADQDLQAALLASQQLEDAELARVLAESQLDVVVDGASAPSIEEEAGDDDDDDEEMAHYDDDWGDDDDYHGRAHDSVAGVGGGYARGSDADADTAMALALSDIADDDAAEAIVRVVSDPADEQETPAPSTVADRDCPLCGYVVNGTLADLERHCERCCLDA